MWTRSIQASQSVHSPRFSIPKECNSQQSLDCHSPRSNQKPLDILHCQTNNNFLQASGAFIPSAFPLTGPSVSPERSNGFPSNGNCDLHVLSCSRPSSSRTMKGMSDQRSRIFTCLRSHDLGLKSHSHLSRS